MEMAVTALILRRCLMDEKSGKWQCPEHVVVDSARIEALAGVLLNAARERGYTRGELLCTCAELVLQAEARGCSVTAVVAED
jgi:hypothetical protein